MDRKYTTHSPFVHDYNPLTHLSQYHVAQPLSAQVTSSLSYRRPNAEGLSPVKRLAKSLPRTTYSDPLTGRVLDFSNPTVASTFASTAAMALVPRLPAVQRIDNSPILAKTKIRAEVSNPITGDFYRVTVDAGALPSLGREEWSPPIRPIRTQTSSPVSKPAGPTQYARSTRKVESVAYVSPHLFS